MKLKQEWEFSQAGLPPTPTRATGLKTNHTQTCGTQRNEGLRVLSDRGGVLTADWQTRQKEVDKVVWSYSTDVVLQNLQDQQLPFLNICHNNDHIL